jgi:hypothetical protein
MEVRISYAITVFNEWEEIQKLIPFLLENKREQDEIVVLWDDKGDQRIPNYFGELIDKISFYSVEFNKNFSDLKNTLNSLCSKEFIFQLDADEIPDKTLIEQLPSILESNDIDAIWIPRINIVLGLSQEYINDMKWTRNELGWINWPNDHQLRVYKNKPEILWKGKVHERITGYQTIANLPDQKEYALWHIKSAERQIKQNEFYNTL